MIPAHRLASRPDVFGQTLTGPSRSDPGRFCARGNASHTRNRQKVEQVKAYFSAVENSHNPLHEAVKDTKGCRLARGKSWMGHAQDSILQVCQRTELNKPRNGKGTQNRFRRLNETLLPENLLKALSRMASRQNRVRDQASH